MTTNNLSSLDFPYFMFDWFSYAQNEDYADWVDVQQTLLNYRLNGVRGMIPLPK